MKSLRVFSLLVISHSLLAQKSQWVHPGANGRLVYGRDQSGIMIPDYSFAGYHSGGVALPTIYRAAWRLAAAPLSSRRFC